MRRQQLRLHGIILLRRYTFIIMRAREVSWGWGFPCSKLVACCAIRGREWSAGGIYKNVHLFGRDGFRCKNKQNIPNNKLFAGKNHLKWKKTMFRGVSICLANVGEKRSSPMREHGCNLSFQRVLASVYISSEEMYADKYPFELGSLAI